MRRLTPFGWLGTGILRCSKVLARMAMLLLRHSGRTLVGLSLSLILTVSGVYFTLLWPQLDEAHGRILQILEGGCSLLLLVNVLSNFALCIATPPGSTDNIAEGYHLAAPPEAVRFCRTCRKAKPPLSHHCSVCHQCVLRMDHHCYCVNNCIGLGNYAHFLRFCSFLLLGSADGAIVLLHHLRSASGREADLQPHRRKFIVAFVLCFGTCVGLAVLMAWHLYLLYVGQTTIEALQRSQSSRNQQKAAEKAVPKKGLATNMKEVFGVDGRWWLLKCLLPTSQATGSDANANVHKRLFVDV